jgi:hypothetical protein
VQRAHETTIDPGRVWTRGIVWVLVSIFCAVSADGSRTGTARTCNSVELSVLSATAGVSTNGNGDTLFTIKLLGRSTRGSIAIAPLRIGVFDLEADTNVFYCFPEIIVTGVSGPAPRYTNIFLRNDWTPFTIHLARACFLDNSLARMPEQTHFTLKYNYNGITSNPLTFSVALHVDNSVHKIAWEEANETLEKIKRDMTFEQISTIIPLTTNSRPLNVTLGGFWYDVPLDPTYAIRLRFEAPFGKENPTGKKAIQGCLLNFPPEVVPRDEPGFVEFQPLALKQGWLQKLLRLPRCMTPEYVENVKEVLSSYGVTYATNSHGKLFLAGRVSRDKQMLWVYSMKALHRVSVDKARNLRTGQ